MALCLLHSVSYYTAAGQWEERMAISKSRRKATHKLKTQDQLLRAEMRRQKATRGDRTRRVVGVAMLLVGVVLLVDSIVSRVGGPHFLAFDTHHNIGQYGGLILLMLGGIRAAGG